MLPYRSAAALFLHKTGDPNDELDCSPYVYCKLHLYAMDRSSYLEPIRRGTVLLNLAVCFWYFMVKKNSLKASLVLLFIPLLFSPIFRTVGYINHYPFPVGHFSFFNRCDSIAVGCLLAFLVAIRGRQLESLCIKYHRLLLGCAILLIIVPLTLTRLFLLGPLTVPFATTSYALGISLLIMNSIFLPKLIYFSWLEWKPIVAIGMMSYSIYLWQQIFCTNPKEYGLHYTPWFLSFPYWLFPVFIIAFLSYNLIEKPFLRLKKRLY